MKHNQRYKKLFFVFVCIRTNAFVGSMQQFRHRQLSKVLLNNFNKTHQIISSMDFIKIFLELESGQY